MTISITASACTYTGDGATTAFEVKDGADGIYFAEASELIVTLRSGVTITTQVLGTHYTVSGAGSDAGTVTFLTAPADDVEVRIERHTPRTQTLALSAAGAFSPTAVMGALDKLTRITQDQARGTGGTGGTFDSRPLTKNPAGTEWDGEGLPLRNIAPAVAAGDAVTFSQLQAFPVALGSGDVVGPPSAVSGNLASFDGATGRVIADSGIDATAAATAVTQAGTALQPEDIGVTVQGYDADTLKSDATALLTAGYTATPYNAGTRTTGTYTPAAANGALQYAVNGGAHTLAPPANNTSIIVQYTNNGSAGAVTTSGFTRVSGAFTTVNGDDFMCYITRNNGFSHLHIQALQ
jgi:hypothetical protein